MSPIEGPLNFTIIKEGDKKLFRYWCQRCVRMKSSGPDVLPKLCFAIKGQIEDIESKEWPDLGALEACIEEGAKEFTCDFSKQRYTTDKMPQYISFTKLTETIDEFNLAEESYYQANPNDLNPIIYLRIGLGYRAVNLEKFPTFELAKFYPLQDQYGLRFTLSPDFQYTINQNILSETQEQFN
mmetsp:Transcript_9498/g.9058  ORF Transcript_9498/g.9058 Transcript_9498/m.9058 type:complete len:183 (-) Transcript_9498:117-665(-)